MPSPNCTGEEMALHTLFDHVEDDEHPNSKFQEGDTYWTLPTFPNDAIYSEAKECCFQDFHVLELFNCEDSVDESIQLEFMQSEIGQAVFGYAYMHPEEWFEAFCPEDFWKEIMDRSPGGWVRKRPSSSPYIQKSCERDPVPFHFNPNQDTACDKVGHEDVAARIDETEADLVNETKEIKDSSLQDALSESRVAADEQENAYIAEAIQSSKLDAIVLSPEDVVVFRISRTSKEILDHLENELVDLKLRVLESGCHVRPDWANGALLLIPLTQSQVEESTVQLRAHHIVACRNEFDSVEKALHRFPKRKGRPQIKVETYVFCSTGIRECDVGKPLEATSALDVATKSSCTVPREAHGLDEHEDEIEIIVERTFIHFQHSAVSEISAYAASAPCSGQHSKEPKNPRKFKHSP